MPPIVVVGLPRGGMVVAAEVARALHAPLYALLVRKIGAPWQPELAVGAVVDGPQARAVLDDHRSSSFGADSAYIAEQTRKAVEEMHRRRARYGAAAVLPSLKGQTVILVDDGVATGLTARAALQSLRSAGASPVVLAVPVAPHGSLLDLARDCDRVVCLAEPDPFHAVGCHYRSFAQVDDDTVVALLSRWPPGPARS